MSPDALSRADLKHLEPLGHHLSLWGAAAQRLLGRLQAERLPPGLTGWLRAWLPPSQPVQLQPGERLEVTVQETASSWQLVESSAPWLADRLWHAWLHLPALRGSWAAELRASHLDSLRGLIPAAWCLEPAPLPPGAVIAGLGLPGWEALTDLRAQGRSFILDPADGGQPLALLHPGVPVEVWQETLAQALASPRQVLAEAVPPGRRLRLCHKAQENRIILESAQAVDES